MSDYGTMKARIAREAAATSLLTEIGEEIQSAIKYYQKYRFAFNKAQISFPTKNATTAYGVLDNADIPFIEKFETARVVGSASTANGWSRKLVRAKYSDIFASLVFEGNTIPQLYAYHDGQIHLWPKTSTGYTVDFAVIKNLGALVDDSDTNAWMTDGEELIRQRAKRMLFNNELQEYNSADRAAMLEAEALDNLNLQEKSLSDDAAARMDELSHMNRGGKYNIYGDVW